MTNSLGKVRSKKRGREKFMVAKPFLCCCIIFLRLFPNRICVWLLQLSRYWKGCCGLVIRYVLLSHIAERCGNNVSVHDGVYLMHPSKLSLGSNISIHPLCYLDAQGTIEIGNDVSIAHNASILSFEHDFSNVDLPIKDMPCIPKPIIIENNVWIGASVRILGGVTIKSGSIIGAGAVVTKDIPPMSIAVGVPAKVIKQRSKANNS